MMLDYGRETSWSTPVTLRVEAVEKIKKRLRALRKSQAEPKGTPYPMTLAGMTDEFRRQYPGLYDVAFPKEPPVPARVRITDVQDLASTWDVRGGVAKAAFVMVGLRRLRYGCTPLALMPPAPSTEQPSGIAQRGTYPMTALQALSAATQAGAPPSPCTLTPTTPRTPNPITPREKQHGHAIAYAAFTDGDPQDAGSQTQAVGLPQPTGAYTQAVGLPQRTGASPLDGLPRPEPTQALGLPEPTQASAMVALPRPRPTRAPGLPKPPSSQPAHGPPAPAAATPLCVRDADEDTLTEDCDLVVAAEHAPGGSQAVAFWLGDGVAEQQHQEGALAAGILADYLNMTKSTRIAKRDASAAMQAPTTGQKRRRLLTKQASDVEAKRDAIAEPPPSPRPQALADLAPTMLERATRAVVHADQTRRRLPRKQSSDLAQQSQALQCTLCRRPLKQRTS